MLVDLLIGKKLRKLTHKKIRNRKNMWKASVDTGIRIQTNPISIVWIKLEANLRILNANGQIRLPAIKVLSTKGSTFKLIHETSV